MNPTNIHLFDMTIRIVSGSAPTSGDIYFTNLVTSRHFDINPYEIYSYSLEDIEKYAVYNTISEDITNFSIHITTTNPVSVFASKSFQQHIDVTNVLPVTALGMEYYGISYNLTHVTVDDLDAYAVVAIEDNTKIYQNEILEVTLDAGDVYYKAYHSITGDHITSNNPVAFFAQNKMTVIHNFGALAVLSQQLAPVHTWGRRFFVPVTVSPDYVRVVVSQDNTNITQSGGVLITDTGGEPTLSNLQAGQFVELEISLSNNGCFIFADKPVGVCSFMKSYGLDNPLRQCSQAWIPAIEQSVSNVLMTPFVNPYFQNHYALICTPTTTSPNTMVSIGDSPPVPLYGGSWHTHTTGGESMSFYDFPFIDFSASYTFSNLSGIIVYGYGLYHTVVNASSYYYLAGSGMRNLSAAFLANDVPYTEMADTLFCVNEIIFTTNISNIAEVDSMKWYKQKTSGNTPDLDYILITDIVEDPPVTWTRTFRAGNYMIKLEVYHNGDPEPLVYEGELCVGAHITIYPTPNDGGMTKPTTGCYKVGTQLPMEAYPY